MAAVKRLGQLLVRQIKGQYNRLYGIAAGFWMKLLHLLSVFVSFWFLLFL